jgi:DNA-directed RNA polymerase subunit alpha
MSEQDKLETKAILSKEELVWADLNHARELTHSEVSEKSAVAELATELQDTLAASRSPEKKSELSARLGFVQWIQKKYGDAAETLKGAHKSSLVSYVRGMCLGKTGDAAGAIKALDDAASRGHDEFEVDLAKALVLRESGQADAAMKLMKSREKGHPDSVELLCEKGTCLEAGGDYEEAIQCFERSVELNPNYAPALFRLAYAYDLRGQDDRALELYERFVELRPTYANALLNLGVLYEEDGRFERAEACYLQVLDADPMNVRAKLFHKDALSSKSMYYDEEAQKRFDRTSRILRAPLTDFELSIRSRNCLKKLNIHTLGDLVQYTEEELLNFKNFGETSLAEIKRLLVNKGLRLGMKVERTSHGPALPEPVEEIATETQKDLLEPIEQLELSVRSRKCLASLGVKTVGDLISKTPEELLSCKNFGQTSLKEVQEKLNQLGLSLSESLSEEPLPEIPLPPSEEEREAASRAAVTESEDELEADDDDDE